MRRPFALCTRLARSSTLAIRRRRSTRALGATRRHLHAIETRPSRLLEGKKFALKLLDPVFCAKRKGTRSRVARLFCGDRKDHLVRRLAYLKQYGWSYMVEFPEHPSQ